MAASQLSNIALWQGYAIGDAGWGDQMNLNLQVLDTLLFPRALDKDLATPPGSPTVGNLYIVATSPTGAWTGGAGKVAIWTVTATGTGSWTLLTPKEGWRIYVDDENFWYYYGGSAWVQEAPVTAADLQGTGLTANEVGFRKIPQNSQSTAYTCVAADSGKHIFHPSADTSARSWEIPSNASVAYPIGTAITFVNQHGAGTITITINTDTMYLAGAGTTGARTLAVNGIATAMKVTATEWIISGTGLT